MRIAYLTSAFGRPSDTFIRNEVDQLRRRGVLVQTFSMRRPPAPPFHDPEIDKHRAQTEFLLETGKVRLVAGAIRQFVRHPLRWFQAAKLAMRTRQPGARGLVLQWIYLLESGYLATRLEHYRIDHIHNHISENSATVAMLTAVLADVPYSLTVHGPGVFFAPEKWCLAEKIDHAAFTACISHFCRSQCMIFALRRSWPRMHIVRCSVQEDFLHLPELVPGNSSFKRIVSVGRLCPEKGALLLIEAASALVDQGVAFQLELIGDGPLRHELETAIKERGLESIVTLAGWKPTPYIRTAISNAHLFVLPSFAEGLPVVLMEALALECPVVTTAIAGHGELVSHGENGWLVPPVTLRHSPQPLPRPAKWVRINCRRWDGRAASKFSACIIRTVKRTSYCNVSEASTTHRTSVQLANLFPRRFGPPSVGLTEIIKTMW
jgi:glycosyltransferase involved in cell wall biosynthesis